MATLPNRTICVTCRKEKITYPCEGCTNRFCFDHLVQHRTALSEELDHIQNDYDQLRQNLNEQKSNSIKHSLIKRIDQWEIDSIDKIQQTAEQCRQQWTKYFAKYLLQIENRLNNLAQEMRRMLEQNEYNETDLNEFKRKLETLQNELHQPPDVSIREQSTSFINPISLLCPWVTKSKMTMCE